MECPEAAEDIAEGDKVRIDVKTGVVENLTKERSYQAEPFPGFMQDIIKVDGLIGYVREGMGDK